MAHTYPFDVTSPPGGQSTGLGDDRIRELKDAIHERQDIDHYWDKAGGNSCDGDDVGKHRKCTFMTQASNPDPAANQSALFTKDGTDTVQPELFFQEENDGSAGDVVQITESGNLKPGVDTTTIELSSGLLQLVANGVAGTHLADSVADDSTLEVDSDALQIKIPTAGASADAAAACYLEWGSYTSDGAEEVITCGGTIVAIIILNGNTSLATGGIAIKTTAGQGQAGIGSLTVNPYITISTVTATIDTFANGATYLNTSGQTYHWVALLKR